MTGPRPCCFNVGRGGGLAGAAAPHAGVGPSPCSACAASRPTPCASNSAFPPCTTPMNDDLSFARVAIRNEVMPALAKALGRDPVPLLNRHADLASQALEAIGELAAGLDPTSASGLVAAPRAGGGRGAEELDR